MSSQELPKELPKEFSKDSIQEVGEDKVEYGTVFTIGSSCPDCFEYMELRSHITQIPHFPELIIMSCVCDSCGYRSNEVKTSSGISPMGIRIKFSLTDPSDLTRDILKSDTCLVLIPEVKLTLYPGTLGSKFTTIESLLQEVYDDIKGRAILQERTGEDQERFEKFLSDIEKVILGEKKATIAMDDPLGNSRIQNLYAPDDDPNMVIEYYKRTREQDEDYGLLDINTEDYEEEEEEGEEEGEGEGEEVEEEEEQS